MTAPARIRLSPAATMAFVPLPDRVARVSLAWWDPAEPEGRREPILVASPVAAARTLVVVWPTDARGLLDAERVSRGEADVVPWDLTSGHLERLRELAQDWPLDRHDLRAGRSIWPTFETLRTLPLGFDLGRRIELAAAQIGG